MKSHRRSRTWPTAAGACSGLPASTRPSRKLVSTDSTRYTLRCARVALVRGRPPCGHPHRQRQALAWRDPGPSGSPALAHCPPPSATAPA